MIFCAIVNSGLLAIGVVVLVDELNDIELIASLVGAGIFIGPVILIQLLSGY